MDPDATADALVEELGLDAPEHFDLELIASHLRAIVRYGPLADEEGHLLRDGRNATITVAHRTRGGHKRGFVIAHEIGHLVGHPTLDDFTRCTGVRASGREGGPLIERQANRFAIALLLPRVLVAARVRGVAVPEIGHVRALADEWRVSLTAAALRWTALADGAACAVAWVRGGRLAWIKASTPLSPTLRRGDAIGAAAWARVVEAGAARGHATEAVDPLAWGLPENVHLLETSWRTPSGVATWLVAR